MIDLVKLVWKSQLDHWILVINCCGKWSLMQWMKALMILPYLYERFSGGTEQQESSRSASRVLNPNAIPFTKLFGRQTRAGQNVVCVLFVVHR